MNKVHFFGAALMMFTTGVHAFIGGPEIYDPLRSTTLPGEVRSVMSVVWHAITLILALSSAGLLWLSWRKSTEMELFLALLFVGFAGLFVAYGMVDLGTLWIMPQWIIFGIAAALIAVAHRRA